MRRKEGVSRERKRLFYFGRRRRDSPPPPGPLAQFPPGGPSAPGQTAQHRQQRRPCQNQGGASTRADHARHDTRPNAGHAAPVCTRYQTDRAGTIGQGAGRGAYNTCMLHTQHFYVLVRLILNILLTCTFNHV